MGLNPKWKMRTAGFAVVASLFALTPMAAFAEKDCHAKMVEELGLSAEQKTKLGQVRGEFRKTLPEKKKAMKSARKDLQKSLREASSDDEIRQKFQELQKREDDFAQARFEKVLAIRSLLTPEQRQKFKGFELRGGCFGHGKHGKHGKDKGFEDESND